MTLTRFLYDAKGLNASALGGQTVHSPRLLEITTPAPTYALSFTLPLGSLGALSSVHVGLDASFTVGWGQSSTIPEDDAVALAIQLPQVTPGVLGFSLQGVLRTRFGTCNLVELAGQRFVLTFNNVGLSLLGFEFPPGYIIDFLISADPHQSDAAANVAWLLALKREEKERLLLQHQTSMPAVSRSGGHCA
ncbi:MAG: hypothetical protein AAGD01_10935 [Acidobacteriota bacterium]